MFAMNTKNEAKELAQHDINEFRMELEAMFVILFGDMSGHLESFYNTLESIIDSHDVSSVDHPMIKFIIAFVKDKNRYTITNEDIEEYKYQYPSEIWEKYL